MGKIPVYTAERFKAQYFEPGITGNGASEAVTGNKEWFEIHRRNDWLCKPLIAPNRLDFYMVSLITGGEAIRKLGMREYYLKRGMLCFIAPGMITSWQSLAESHAGYFCIFPAPFFSSSPGVDLLADYPFFQTENGGAVQLTEEQLPEFCRFFEEIEREYLIHDQQYADVVRSYLTILFKKAQRIYEVQSAPDAAVVSSAGLRLTMAFTRLYEDDFAPLVYRKPADVKSLDAYAALLHVSQNHLNDTVKAVTGKTPGTLIRERMIREASLLLIHTQLSVAEICFLLKFEDPSYFSRFFKKYTGITPLQYRKGVMPVISS